MVNISTNINKANNTSNLKSFNTEMTTTYEVGNLGPGLGSWETQTSGEVKRAIFLW